MLRLQFGDNMQEILEIVNSDLPKNPLNWSEEAKGGLGALACDWLRY
jgi:hypothetical protein